MAEWTPEQAEAFGTALTDLLHSRGLKRPALAEVLGVTPELVRQWEAGQTEPPRARVFALEKHFGLRPGSLSRLLGYLPVNARATRTVADAIDADPSLSEIAREGLRAAYRAMAGH